MLSSKIDALVEAAAKRPPPSRPPASPTSGPATSGSRSSWVAGVLAAIKSSVAQKWGNGTAATLPVELEPVPQPAEPVDQVAPEIAHVEHLLSPTARQST